MKAPQIVACVVLFALASTGFPCPTNSEDTQAALSAGEITITGQQNGATPERDEDEPIISRVKIGEPVEIDASAIDAKLYFWHSCDRLEASIKRYTKDGRIDSILAFWPPRPGSYSFLLVMTSNDVPSSREFIVHVSPRDDDDDDDDDDEPSPLGLREHVKKTVESSITGATRLLEARAHAELYEAVSDRMKTTANPSGDLVSIKAVQDAQRNVNIEYRASLVKDRQELWAAYFAKGGPLATKLNELGQAGKLTTLDQVFLAWDEIIEGFEEVR